MAEHINTFLAGIRSWANRRRPIIFISYRRRGEGAGYGGRIADRLVEHFGKEQCFLDVVDIGSGIDFVKTIREAVGTCKVLIAVIGPDWITQTNDRGTRRLDDPRDFVRLEVAAALERDIRVIPVLVGGAEVPLDQELPEVLEALSRRQAHELTDSRWEYDISTLIGAIESMGVKGLSRSKRAGSLGVKRLAVAASAVGGALLAAALTAGAFFAPKEPSESPPAAAVEPKTALQTTAKLDDGPRRELERQLERERQKVVDAERKAASERQARRDREAELARAREARDVKEAAEQVRAKELSRTEVAPVRVSERGADGIQGTARVSWQHEGVVYTATVVTSGSEGQAVVTYLNPLTGLQVGAEEDLELFQNANGTFFLGSNPRVPGTQVPHPLYSPDIFRLSRMQNGNWAITEVGASWEHFDRAVTVP